MDRKPAGACADLNLIDIGSTSMTTEQMDAFEEAAAIWEWRFNDPITVTINVAWDDASQFPSSSILAATTTARTINNQNKTEEE